MTNNQPSVDQVKAIYDRAYNNPGLMGTHLDTEYSRVTKTKLLEICQGAIPPRLLDVGTGDGDLWQFAPEGWEWHALDISPVGVGRAVERFSKVKGVAGIAENLPYPSQYFGAVVAADTIEHVFDLNNSLKEIRRVISPGGVFALSVPTPNSLPKWAYNQFIGQRPSPVLFLRLVHTIILRTILFGRPAFQPIDRDLSLDQWKQLLNQNGFVVEQTISWPEPPHKPIVYLIGARSAG